MDTSAAAASAAVMVITSCPAPTGDGQSRDVAAELSRALVEERWAACVSVVAGARSTSRWQGALCVEPEVLCLIKTTADRAPGLMRRLAALHPYEVPEMLVLEVGDAWPPYLAWLVAETRPR